MSETPLTDELVRKIVEAGWGEGKPMDAMSAALLIAHAREMERKANGVTK